MASLIVERQAGEIEWEGGEKCGLVTQIVDVKKQSCPCEGGMETRPNRLRIATLISFRSVLPSKQPHDYRRVALMGAQPLHTRYWP